MNDYYIQHNFRDWFSLCLDISSQSMSKQAESMFRAMSAGTYYSDFITLMDILSGKYVTRLINKEIIDNASKYYKQANKALLVFQHLTDTEKQKASAEFDSKASRLVDEWCRQLHAKNIRIIQTNFL